MSASKTRSRVLFGTWQKKFAKNAAWRVLALTAEKFSEIDGAHRAAAFAYYTLFSVFPGAVLFVTIGSHFVKRQVAVENAIEYARIYLPLEASVQSRALASFNGLIEGRGKVGIGAAVALLWGASQLFKALVRATNRAWKTDMHNWWQMPLKNLLLLAVLASAIMLGIAVPLSAQMVEHQLPAAGSALRWLTVAAEKSIPALVMFYGIAWFYRLAPRRPTRFSEVWLAALGAAVLLRVVEGLFELYVRNVGNFNLVYGTFGGIMALLTWIYLSGCIIVWGACLTAAQAEVAGKAMPRPTAPQD